MLFKYCGFNTRSTISVKHSSTRHEQHLHGVASACLCVSALAHRRGKQSSNETSNESNLIIIQNGARLAEEETRRETEESPSLKKATFLRLRSR